MKKVSFIILLTIALGASAVTIFVDHMIYHPAATEAQAAPALEGIQFTPQHRKDDHVDESFFFYNSKTGDIWVYQEDKPKEHYRVVSLGEKLKKLNRDFKSTRTNQPFPGAFIACAALRSSLTHRSCRRRVQDADSASRRDSPL
jgi:hypothetical protein